MPKNKPTRDKRSNQPTLTFPDDKKAMAVNDLPTVMDLIRWINGALSQAIKSDTPFNDEHSKQFMAVYETDNLWDTVAMYVFTFLHMPVEKSSLLMYSNLSPSEKEALLLDLENTLTQLIRSNTQSAV